MLAVQFRGEKLSMIVSFVVRRVRRFSVTDNYMSGACDSESEKVMDFSDGGPPGVSSVLSQLQVLPICPCDNRKS
jgi:hypothetical protein